MLFQFINVHIFNFSKLFVISYSIWVEMCHTKKSVKCILIHQIFYYFFIGSKQYHFFLLSWVVYKKNDKSGNMKSLTGKKTISRTLWVFLIKFLHLLLLITIYFFMSIKCRHQIGYRKIFCGHMCNFSVVMILMKIKWGRKIVYRTGKRKQ